MALSAVRTTARAQTTRLAAITVGTGVLLIPRLAGECGGDSGGLEANAGLILRPLQHFIVESDARAAGLVTGDCAGAAVAVDTSYDTRTPEPYFTASVKLGYETPASLPLVRLTAGIGSLWSGRPSAYGVFGVAWSTRGSRGRLFVEAERTETRIRGTERRHDVTSQRPDITRSFHVGASTQSYRIGIEWPLRSRAR